MFWDCLTSHSFPVGAFFPLLLTSTPSSGIQTSVWLPGLTSTPVKMERIWCDLSTQVDKLTNYIITCLSVNILLKEYLHLYFLTLIIIVDFRKLQVRLCLSHLREKRLFLQGKSVVSPTQIDLCFLSGIHTLGDTSKRAVFFFTSSGTRHGDGPLAFEDEIPHLRWYIKIYSHYRLNILYVIMSTKFSCNRLIDILSNFVGIYLTW